MSVSTVLHVAVSSGHTCVLVLVGRLEPVAMTYPKEVAQGNREADGEGRAAQVVTTAVVRGGEDAEHQLQGQEELHSHGLACGGVVVELGGGGGDQCLKQPAASAHLLLAPPGASRPRPTILPPPNSNHCSFQILAPRHGWTWDGLRLGGGSQNVIDEGDEICKSCALEFWEEVPIAAGSFGLGTRKAFTSH